MSITVRDLSEEHVGMVVLGVPGIAGWEQHLLLVSVEHGRREDGETYLAFRWNDDPSPSNTQRGRFAVGTYVNPGVHVRVLPPAKPEETA